MLEKVGEEKKELHSGKTLSETSPAACKNDQSQRVKCDYISQLLNIFGEQSYKVAVPAENGMKASRPVNLPSPSRK